MIKKYFFKSLCLPFILITISLSGQMKVGGTTVTIDSSAAFEIESTEKGFLPPRLTEGQRDSIFQPATGLIIYNITNACIELNVGTPTNPDWSCLAVLVVKTSSRYPSGYVHCLAPDTTVIQNVTSTTGAVWMDRNLGASQVATSYFDQLSFGSLFQWGRFADGHQCRDSDSYSGSASTATPFEGNPWDGKFIVNPADEPNKGWLTTKVDTLWQGINGTNNPCPSGYRLATRAEWDAERKSWSSQNRDGAFGSPLKLPAAGDRQWQDGVVSTSSSGSQWSSTIYWKDTPQSERTYFGGSAGYAEMYRSHGASVRCLLSCE